MFRFTDTVILRLTRDCNINCKYCFMIEKDLYKGEIIIFSLYKKIIDRIIHQRVLNDRDQQNLSLVFHGGEALMVGKKSFYKMLDYAANRFKENGISYNFGIQTNAMLIDDEFGKMLNKFEVGVGLSFDGIDGANSARTETKQSIFENKFDVLERNKVNYGFIVVVGKNNIDKLDKTKAYLNNLKGAVHGYKLNYAEDIFKPGQDDNIEVPGDELFEKVFKPEIENILNDGQSKESHTNEILNRILIDLLTHHDDRVKTGCNGKFCGAGVTMIGVNPDGEVHYCDRYSKEFKETYMQHALDYDFLGLRQIRSALDFNKEIISSIEKTGCDTCYADYICEHGCQAMHYSKFGEYGIEENLVCNFNKSFYDYVLENLDDIIVSFAKNGKTIPCKDEIFLFKETMRQHFKRKNIDISLDENKIVIKELNNELQ